MTDKLTLAAVDRDGAIEEMLDKIDGEAAASRGIFLKKSAVLSGGLIGGGALLGTLAKNADAATATDADIANFALTLEYLEAAFYTEAVQMGALSGDVARFARIVAAHERTHVAALKKMLGAAAVASPSFNFQGTTESQAKFKATAQVLEDTGVMAYAGQAPRIQSTAILKAALAIHTVEARHASWIRHINGAPPAPVGFDKPKTMQQILAAVTGTGFISSGPAMTASGSNPSFTG
ncbi:MAG: ferritin-like domain-containing protein [Actinobacteria bacterium]|nr:ferritin-like domain-containing protein [Actinomycetota bacterium]